MAAVPKIVAETRSAMAERKGHWKTGEDVVEGFLNGHGRLRSLSLDEIERLEKGFNNGRRAAITRIFKNLCPLVSEPDIMRGIKNARETRLVDSWEGL